MNCETEEFAPKPEPPEKRGRVRPKKQASFLAVMPTAATEPIPFSLLSAAQGNSASHPSSCVLSALENVLSRIKSRNGFDPKHDELEQPSSRSSVDSGKRKRGEEDLGDSLEDEVAIVPTERKKSKTSIKLGHNLKHPQDVIPGAASAPEVSSELTFGTSTSLAADVTRGIGDLKTMQLDVEDVKDVRSSQQPPSSQNV